MHPTRGPWQLACCLLATRGRGRPYKHAGRNLTKILYSFLTSNSSLRQMSSLVEWKLSLTCKEPLQWWRGCGITQPRARCRSAVLRRYPRGFVKCDASFSQPVQQNFPPAPQLRRTFPQSEFSMLFDQEPLFDPPHALAKPFPPQCTESKFSSCRITLLPRVEFNSIKLFL